jgi:two-component system OmpR family sensor kinase
LRPDARHRHHERWHAWHHAWHDWQRGGFIAHYMKASLHRRIFFLLGAAIVMNGLVAGCIAHIIGFDGHNRTRGILVLAFFILLMWGASGKLARGLTRPFVELARVAQEIGKGNLDARYVFRRRGRTGESFLLGVAINQMAERIGKQIRDQRELLAAVSHEVRTPLARIRMLAELGRSEASGERFLVDGKTFDDLDREVMEIDALIGELLASSRLDFAAITRVPLEAGDVARRALERQTMTPPLLLPDAPVPFTGDPTLLQRALANLLHNAVVHAGGVDALVVLTTPGTVRFAVKDRGPGIAKGEERKVFESFYRGPSGNESNDHTHSALGLGLALVDRIAKAHGGHAFAECREDGPGACIGIEIPKQALGAVTSS